MMRSINQSKEDVMRMLKVIAITMILLSASVTVGYTARAAPCPGDIIDTLCQQKDLSTTLKLIRAAGLEDELRQPGPMTLFAPTNKAWSKCSQDVICALEKPENREKLRCILLYHVLKTKLAACDILKLDCPTQFTTMQGGKVCISHKGKKMYVNQARIVKADIVATNGVIHAIDRVLVPPGVTLPGGCPPCGPSNCPGACPGPCPS
jgi:uncharacterized surface protein with fasciclin (FAS1) repeats